MAGSSNPKRDFARGMRKAPVSTEKLLWKLLRDRRLEGLKFRRQVPLGPYVADFVCFASRLIVEADGPTHEDSAHDIQRDDWLRSEGFRVLRLPNDEVHGDPDGTLWIILRAARPLG